MVRNGPQNFIPIDVIQVTDTTNVAVPVVATFSNNGNIRPLYVQIKGERYKILSSLSREYGLDILTFNCTVENYGIRRELILTYHKNETCWTMKL